MEYGARVHAAPAGIIGGDAPHIHEVSRVPKAMGIE
ncbi:MAG: hypothetical protein A4E40_00875 [Methanoregulaceae archaeon PtaU1.Bin059]|nr:MAG: hypothetical protein A4E40_00875 [Methanoregulaceae archaeon PtaU1.Bin059]